MKINISFNTKLISDFLDRCTSMFLHLEAESLAQDVDYEKFVLGCLDYFFIVNLDYCKVE